jgi:hypothetical protein
MDAFRVRVDGMGKAFSNYKCKLLEQIIVLDRHDIGEGGACMLTGRERNFELQFRLERAALDWMRLNRGCIVRVPNPAELLKAEPELTPTLTPTPTPTETREP